MNTGTAHQPSCAKDLSRSVASPCSPARVTPPPVLGHVADMLRLKKSYEMAIEARNYTGIVLIDRNDELCILYEKANIQDEILRRGELLQKQREDEIRILRIEVTPSHRVTAFRLRYTLPNALPDNRSPPHRPAEGPGSTSPRPKVSADHGSGAVHRSNAKARPGDS